MPLAGQKRKRAGHKEDKHPYLVGNFTPVKRTLPLTPCTFTGSIPKELIGGQYVRNGANPVSNEDLGRDCHWFDGDGMLAGVLFKQTAEGEAVQPEFVNQYILTDVYLTTITSPNLRGPILPSIATLVNPVSTIILVLGNILRSVALVILSHLPGSKQAIKKISVANTHFLYHDGRALATCESGPPIRVQLPELETVGWYNGSYADGEPKKEACDDGREEILGGEGLMSWMKEWTTGHPKVDPITNEMVLYHCHFQKPFVFYSVIPATKNIPKASKVPETPRLVNAPVQGVSGSRMMHDFGVSLRHTVIMDLPLTLDFMNGLSGKPSLHYDVNGPSRFGVFPRHDPGSVRWFETSACCIFHTANTWDIVDKTDKTTVVNMLACWQNSSDVVFRAGNIISPIAATAPVEENVTKPMPFFDKYDDDEECTFDQASHIESTSKVGNATMELDETDIVALAQVTEQCRLYYYSFNMSTGKIRSEYALSTIPFEFPSVRPSVEMQAARYVYGCSTEMGSFGAALGRTGIDVLAKVDVATLIARGEANPPTPVTGCVDNRLIKEVLASTDSNDPISCFRMPEKWYAQEPRFVPREDGTSEDDGFLLFYAFDENQLNQEGECPPEAVSQLWVIDAKNMTDVVARIELPQRVPYGLHGNWFPQKQIEGQREVEKVRSVEEIMKIGEGRAGGLWMGIRGAVERWLG